MSFFKPTFSQSIKSINLLGRDIPSAYWKCPSGRPCFGSCGSGLTLAPTKTNHTRYPANTLALGRYKLGGNIWTPPGGISPLTHTAHNLPIDILLLLFPPSNSFHCLKHNLIGNTAIMPSTYQSHSVSPCPATVKTDTLKWQNSSTRPLFNTKFVTSSSLAFIHHLASFLGTNSQMLNKDTRGGVHTSPPEQYT